MRRAELIMAVVMAALSAYFMWKSAELPIGWIKREGPGGGAFSFWLAAVMLACTGWIIINWSRRTSPPSQSEEPFMDAYATKMFLLIGGSLTAMIGLVHIIGMHLATAVYLVYYLRFLGRHTWSLTVAVAVATPVFIFFFFDITLNTILPVGYLEPVYLILYDIFL